MRFLILSDVHSNWEALQSVLRHVRRKRFDRVLFLGDAVGYGASPNRVMDWLRSLSGSDVAVRGNHDRVCAGIDSSEYFNRYAQEASDWTNEHLSKRNLEVLAALPSGPIEISDQVAMCHGSTVDEDAYIFSAYDAQLALGEVEQSVVFFGHTHVPSLFMQRPSNGMLAMNARMLSGRRLVVDLDPNCRYLINPGSVGQPRDRDPRAAYAIFDDVLRRLYVYRVSYRVKEARHRIIQAGLPPVLGDRLLFGA